MTGVTRNEEGKQESSVQVEAEPGAEQLQAPGWGGGLGRALPQGPQEEPALLTP